MKKPIFAIALLSVMPLGAMNSLQSPDIASSKVKSVWSEIAKEILNKDDKIFDKVFNKNKDKLTKEDFNASIQGLLAYIPQKQIQRKIIRRVMD